MKFVLTEEEVKEAVRDYVKEKTGIRPESIVFHDAFNCIAILGHTDAYQEMKHEQQSRTTAQPDTLPDKPF